MFCRAQTAFRLVDLDRSQADQLPHGAALSWAKDPLSTNAWFMLARMAGLAPANLAAADYGELNWTRTNVSSRGLSPPGIVCFLLHHQLTVCCGYYFATSEQRLKIWQSKCSSVTAFWRTSHDEVVCISQLHTVPFNACEINQTRLVLAIRLMSEPPSDGRISRTIFS